MSLAEKIRHACMMMYQLRSYQMTLHRDEWLQILEALQAFAAPRVGDLDASGPGTREAVQTRSRTCAAESTAAAAPFTQPEATCRSALIEQVALWLETHPVYSTAGMYYAKQLREGEFAASLQPSKEKP